MFGHLEGAVSRDDLLEQIHRLGLRDHEAAGRRGRDGRCSCGSGRKYKHCHGPANRKARKTRDALRELSEVLAEVARPVIEALGPLPRERLDVVLLFAALAWNISREPDRVTRAFRMAKALEGMGDDEAALGLEEVLAFMVGRAGRLHPDDPREVARAWSEPLPGGGYRVVAASTVTGS
jgi:hypothetical protein